MLDEQSEEDVGDEEHRRRDRDADPRAHTAFRIRLDARREDAFANGGADNGEEASSQKNAERGKHTAKPWGHRPLGRGQRDDRHRDRSRPGWTRHVDGELVRRRRHEPQLGREESGIARDGHGDVWRRRADGLRIRVLGPRHSDTSALLDVGELTDRREIIGRRLEDILELGRAFIVTVHLQQGAAERDPG